MSPKSLLPVSTSAVVVYDETKVYADISVSIKLTKDEAEQTMVLEYPAKYIKGHTLADIGSSIQRNIYEQLREGYARLLDQVAEAGKKD